MTAVIPLGIQVGRFLTELETYRLGKNGEERRIKFSSESDDFDLMGELPKGFWDLFIHSAPIYGTLNLGSRSAQFNLPAGEWWIAVYGEKHLERMEKLADMLMKKFDRRVSVVLTREDEVSESSRLFYL